MYYVIEKQHDRIFTNSMANYEFKTVNEAVKKLVALNDLLSDDQKKYISYFVVEKLYPTDE